MHLVNDLWPKPPGTHWWLNKSGYLTCDEEDTHHRDLEGDWVKGYLGRTYYRIWTVLDAL